MIQLIFPNFPITQVKQGHRMKELQKEEVLDEVSTVDALSLAMVDIKKLVGKTDKRVLDRISLEKNKKLSPVEIQLKKETLKQRRFVILDHVF